MIHFHMLQLQEQLLDLLQQLSCVGLSSQAAIWNGRASIQHAAQGDPFLCHLTVFKIKLKIK